MIITVYLKNKVQVSFLLKKPLLWGVPRTLGSPSVCVTERFRRASFYYLLRSLDILLYVDSFSRRRYLWQVVEFMGGFAGSWRSQVLLEEYEIQAESGGRRCPGNW